MSKSANMLSPAQLDAIKAANPCDVFAGKRVKLRTYKVGKFKGGFIGPCPICCRDPKSSKTCFEVTREKFVCAKCDAGGDIFKLVALVNGLDPAKDFRKVVDMLGGKREVDPEDEARVAREHAAKAAKAEREAQAFRDRELERVLGIWRHGTPIAGTPVETYLREHRRLTLPDSVNLRCILDMPYWGSGKRDAEVIHRGPAKLAPIVGLDGVMCALHMTWLDLAQPNGKAVIRDDAGELMPAKKVRGSKAGGRIELAGDCAAATRWIIGEGIETVLSVFTALAGLGRDLGNTAFVSSVDLGNLAGRAVDRVAHPSLKDAAGRTRRISGWQPDYEAPALVTSERVNQVILLGDGDSDPFTTQCAIARAGTRLKRLVPDVRVAWSPPGQDFNDLLRAA